MEPQPEFDAAYLRRAIRWVSKGTAVAVGVWIFASAAIVSSASASDRVEYFKGCVDGLSAILVAGGVALLGTLIPAGLTAAREEFARKRESRREFSEVQTATYYLAVRMSACDLRSAGRMLHRVHVHKHMAQLYDDLEDHLRRRDDPRTPKQWADEQYEVLTALGRVLEASADTWPTLKPQERLALLNKAQLAAEAECAAARKGTGGVAVETPH